MLKDFKTFALRGNVVDMAVGIIIGAMFGTIVSSLVSDILMPPIGLLVGNVNFTDLFTVLKEGTSPGPYLTLSDAKAAGAVTLNYGVFINTLISFIIVVFVVFLLVRYINKIRQEKEKAPAAVPTAKQCPYCLSTIPIKAIRCAFCTADLQEKENK